MKWALVNTWPLIRMMTLYKIFNLNNQNLYLCI